MKPGDMVTFEHKEDDRPVGFVLSSSPMEYLALQHLLILWCGGWRTEPTISDHTSRQLKVI